MEMELNQIVIFTGNLMSTLTLLFPTLGVKNGSTICIASFKAGLTGLRFTPCPILSAVESAVKNQDSKTEKCESMKIEETRDFHEKIIHCLCDEKYPHFG